MSGDASGIQQALVEHASDLRAFLARRASASLLRFETADDLYQGFASEVLARADRFEDRGPGSQRAWLFEVARNFVRERHRHWSALKRGSGKVLRSGLGDPSRSGSAGSGDPAASDAGPGSLAARREELLLVAKALALLLPRDRQLIEWSSEGLTLVEMSERLEMGIDATSRARSRAVERLRKTHELVQRRGNLG